MAEQDAVSEVLEALQGEASYDSHGEFSLDELAAARKHEEQYRGAYALPLLLGIQAANAARAAHVVIDSSVTGWEMSFALPQVGQRVLDRLKLALGVGLALEGEEFRLELGSGLAYLLQAGTLRRVQRRLKTGRAGMELLLPARQKQGWRSRLVAEVAWRARMSVTDVIVDHGLVSSGLADGLELSEPSTTGLVPWLAEQVTLGEGFGLASPVRRPARRVYGGTRWLQARSPAFQVIVSRFTGLPDVDWQSVLEPGGTAFADRSCCVQSVPTLQATGLPALDKVRLFYCPDSAHFLLPPARPGSWPRLKVNRWLGLGGGVEPGRLFYVQDGLLLDPISTQRLALGVVACVADSEVETDLTFLRAVQTPLVLREIERLVVCQRESRMDAADYLNEELPGDRSDPWWQLHARWRQKGK
ncbi:hypothetical protein IV102_35705 [bacterium]|nr:hypothetical protein [bacterium]